MKRNSTVLFSTCRPWVDIAFIAALLVGTRPAGAQMPVGEYPATGGSQQGFSPRL